MTWETLERTRAAGGSPLRMPPPTALSHLKPLDGLPPVNLPQPGRGEITLYNGHTGQALDANRTPAPEVKRLPRTSIVVPFSWEYGPKLFIRSLHALQRWEGCPIVYVDGGTIYAMRNTGVDVARKKGAEGVLFVDADMVFEEDALKRIVSHNKPVVSGLCRKRRKPFSTVTYTRQNGQFCQLELRGTGLHPVDGVGGAFLYVQMEVFDALEQPYFVNREAILEEVVDQQDFLGEDLFFCHKVREAGIPIFVDLDLIIGHLTPGIVTTDPETKKCMLLMQ